MTLYFVPQLPIKNRYQEDWLKIFPREFEKLGVNYETVLGGSKKSYEKKDFFSDIKQATLWELTQLQYLTEKVKDGDKIFFADIDFPGFSHTFAQNIKLLEDVKIFGYLHAGSYIEGDIYSKVGLSKSQCENSYSYILDKIFVATNFHREIFGESVGGTGGIEVVGFPFYRTDLPDLDLNTERTIDVIHTSRIDKQHTDTLLIEITKNFPDLKFVSTSPISESVENLRVIKPKNRLEYYKLLSKSRIYLSTSRMDTFGIGTVEAVAMGCIPLVPDHSAFPEVIQESYYRYNNKDELKQKLDYISSSHFCLDPSEPPINWKKFENSIKTMVEIMEIN
jgi:glycosyltransferase involved in cell wall biosynthesis